MDGDDRMGTPAQEGVLEPWAVAAGLSGGEWAAFLAVRDALRAQSVGCPWCKGEGSVQWGGGYGSCSACDGTGSTSRWLAQHCPGDDDAETVIPAIADELGSASARWGDLPVPCPECGGQGAPCLECHRSGQVPAIVAATREIVRCLRCDGKRYGGSPMLEWPCSYCGLSGTISIRAFDRLSCESFAETFCGYFSIEQMVREGEGSIYPDCPDELDARWEARPGVVWHGVDLGSDDLSGLDLSGADLSGCELGNVAGTKFVGANLTNAVFGSSSRSGESARGCDFTDAILDGADLSRADLTESNVERAASLEGCSLGGGIGLTRTQVQVCLERRAHIARPAEEFPVHDV